MTDTEIIKALECCSIRNHCASSCPYDDEDDTCVECTSKLTKDALALINRQKAEIERLRNTVKTDFLTVTEKLKLSQSEIRDIRTEAIKEFAERLKEHTEDVGFSSYTERWEFGDWIDSLVEEITVNYESSKNDKQRKEDGK